MMISDRHQTVLSRPWGTMANIRMAGRLTGTIQDNNGARLIIVFGSSYLDCKYPSDLQQIMMHGWNLFAKTHVYTNG